jgi:aminoglycoside 6-adenylyltransferase
MLQRDETTMLNLILDIAKNDEGIRAVILNGSRASPGAKKDSFQDYDIVYIVNNIEPYIENRQWLKHFGELVILQTPEEMDGIWPQSKDLFGFLMLFTDGNRIDLRLISHIKYSNMARDSQSIVLLDKDLIMGEFGAPSDRDYLPSQLTENEFDNCCNEFFWVSTNIAKGICRKQLTYVKYMSEQIVKEQLIKLLIGYVAIKTNFKKIIGAYAKHLQELLEPEMWDKFRKTYVDAEYENIWNGLFLMHEIFNEIGLKVSKHYGYRFDLAEAQKVAGYLQTIRNTHA